MRHILTGGDGARPLARLDRDRLHLGVRIYEKRAFVEDSAILVRIGTVKRVIYLAVGSRRLERDHLLARERRRRGGVIGGRRLERGLLDVMDLEVVKPIRRSVVVEIIAGVRTRAKAELNLVRAGWYVRGPRCRRPACRVADHVVAEHLVAVARDANDVVPVPHAPPGDRGRPDDCSRESADVPCLYTRAQRDAVERLLRLDAKGRRTGHGQAPLEVSKPHCIPNVAL